MARANPIVNAETASDAPQRWEGNTRTLSPPRTLWGDVWRRFRRHMLAIAERRSGKTELAALLRATAAQGQ